MPSHYETFSKVQQWKARAVREMSFEHSAELTPRFEGLQIEDYVKLSKNELCEKLGVPKSCKIFVDYPKGNGQSRSLPHLFGNHERFGLFSLVSGVAPSGDPYLEDLLVWDDTDSSEYLVTVKAKQGDNWAYYRCLRHRGCK